MDFSSWKKDYSQMNKKYFFLKVKERFAEQFIARKFGFKTKLTKEQKERIENFYYYSYLKKIYLPKIKDFPVDLSFSAKNTTKIVWWCWLQGEENAPLLCKKCLASIRKFLPDYEIKIVTQDNMFELIELPDYVKTKYLNGKISRTHFSDILRTCLLVQYGGVWIDSSVLLTDNPSFLFENPLFYFKNYDRGDEAISGSSWLISSAKDNPVLVILKELLFEYWKENDFLIHYYLFHLFLRMINEVYPCFYDSIPTYSNIPPHILQKEIYNEYDENRFNQIKEISKVHKLNWKLDSTAEKINGTNYQFILEKL